ncbi:hypothetical protein [Fulvivirga sedimenti]|uniref:Uncharacterized protein n=1 Tax=Fulvivirga sedimenti TaxID=2879465 RepID=A0A9X1HQC9_9BACT|nr:hypothetical protein [Fulvivirga sedimenti]MCA6075216.1 hypothetical protein [Fulvivirga sedimenti]MCA6076393.1 hypothetical protein [Fulvivirga sedimenti]MCA6077521.1 hypothetical protein [Fulvivirga sedimenti]
MKFYSAVSNNELQIVFYMILLGSVFFICHECIGMFLNWVTDSYSSISAQANFR